MKKYFILLVASIFISQAYAQNNKSKNKNETKPAYIGEVLVLKVASNKSCKFYVDGEFKATIEADQVFKLNLKKGEYQLKAVSNENPEIIFKEIYAVETAGVEKFYEINLSKVLPLSNSGKAVEANKLTADSIAKVITELNLYKGLFDNQKLKISNECNDDFKIGVLNVTYWTEDHKKLIKTELWYDRTIKKGSSLKLGVFEGTRTVWDGSVVSYSLGIEYKGANYIISGIFQNDMNPEDKTLHINFDDL